MEISHSCSTSCWWWPRKQANFIFVDYIIFILFSHLLWKCALHKYNLWLSTMNSFILNSIVLFSKHTFSTFQWTFSSISTSFNHSAAKSSLADRWGGVCPLLLLVLLYNHLGESYPTFVSILSESLLGRVVHQGEEEPAPSLTRISSSLFCVIIIIITMPTISRHTPTTHPRLCFVATWYSIH